jgi:hypothetical protein
MKFPPFLHSHLRLTLLGTPPNRVFFKPYSRIDRPTTSQIRYVAPKFNRSTYIQIAEQCQKIDTLHLVAKD